MKKRTSPIETDAALKRALTATLPDMHIDDRIHTTTSKKEIREL